jgi:hypothetical protein
MTTPYRAVKVSPVSNSSPRPGMLLFHNFQHRALPQQCGRLLRRGRTYQPREAFVLSASFSTHLEE